MPSGFAVHSTQLEAKTAEASVPITRANSRSLGASEGVATSASRLSSGLGRVEIPAVSMGEECRTRRCTTFTFAPERTKAVMQENRREWRSALRPAAS